MRLAWPLIIGQASGVAMSFVDSLMAGRLSALDLAAVALGATMWTSLNLFVIGTLLSIPAFVSQFDGANQRERVGPFIHQAAWVAGLLSVGVFLAARNVSPLLELLGVEDAVLPLTANYLDAISWGAPFWAGFLVLRFLSDGIGITRPFMYVGILGFLVNIPADYVLMFGKLGLPELGAEGCGWATALVLASQLLFMSLYVARGRHYQSLQLFRQWAAPRLETTLEILKVGLPIGAAIFFEASMFMMSTLLMGTLGTIAVAGHQISFNFSALLFMVPLGLGMAITVRVGNAMGRGDLEQALFRGQTGMALTLINQCLAAALLLLFPESIARLYSSNPEVIDTAVSLLFFAALLQLSDGLQAAAAGALRGIKDTRTPLLFIAVAYWGLGIPLGWWLGIRQGMNGPGIWIGMIVALTFAALCLTWRFFLRLSRMQRESETGSLG